MKNIVAKVPGASPDILLFTTHFDSKRIANLWAPMTEGHPPA